MSKEITNYKELSKEALFEVLVTGNIIKLNGSQKLDYTQALISSLGLNALSRPFQFITFQGKEILYATKDCTEQLRKIHGVSVEDCTIQMTEKVIIATAKVRDYQNKTDIATGVVPMPTSSTDLANAIMKAETKAKRRATLSICGLGILDESEIEDMKQMKNITPQTSKIEDAIKNAPEIKSEVAPIVEILQPEKKIFRYEIDLTTIEDEAKKQSIIDYCLNIAEKGELDTEIIEGQNSIEVIGSTEYKKLAKFLVKGK